MYLLHYNSNFDSHLESKIVPELKTEFPQEKNQC